MTQDNLDNDNLGGSSEEIINNDEQSSTSEVTPTQSEEVTISKEELDALKIKAEKFEKKEGDFEKLAMKQKTQLKENKVPETKINEEDIVAKAVKQIEEKNFFTAKGILHDEDREALKRDASILGVSLEEAFNNEVVKTKLEKVAQDRATKASEDDITLNSVFSEAEFMSDDAFEKSMQNGQTPQTKENIQRLNKISGLVL